MKVTSDSVNSKNQRVKEILKKDAKYSEDIRNLNYNGSYKPNQYYVMDNEYVPKTKYDKGFGYLNWTNFQKPNQSLPTTPTLTSDTQILYPNVEGGMQRQKFVIP